MMMSTGTRTGNPGLPADLLEDGIYNQTQQVEENIDTFTPQCELNTQNLESLKPHPGSEILIFPLNFGNLSSATAIRVPDARLRIFMHNNNNTEDFVRYWYNHRNKPPVILIEMEDMHKAPLNVTDFIQTKNCTDTVSEPRMIIVSQLYPARVVSQDPCEFL